jgi:hypothetical protein
MPVASAPLAFRKPAYVSRVRSSRILVLIYAESKTFVLCPLLAQYRS